MSRTGAHFTCDTVRGLASWCEALQPEFVAKTSARGDSDADVLQEDEGAQESLSARGRSDCRQIPKRVHGGRCASSHVLCRRW
jgi:hypothetical protein